MADTYTPVEAARVLNISEKRARQLCEPDRRERGLDYLVAVTAKPLTIDQQSVHDLREKRKTAPPASGGAATRQAKAAGGGVGDLAAVLAQFTALVERVERSTRLAIESARADHEAARAALEEQLLEERARRLHAEAALVAGANGGAAPASAGPDGSAWSLERIRALGATTDISTASRILGFSAATGRRLANAGEFPTPVMRAGSRYRVPVPALLQTIGVFDGQPESAG